MKIKAKDFLTRLNLESFVRSKINLTPVLKPQHKIVGTVKDLARLHLSEKSIFWGIHCEVKNSSKHKEMKKIARGKRHPSGITKGTKKYE